MSQLIQLRQKIKSIKTTQRITYAMRLISMSLYSRLEKNNAALTHYKQEITEIFQKISRFSEKWNNNILFPKDILDSNPLFIIVTSSKGLCGGFNINLIKYFKQTFFLEEHKQPTFITIGYKSHSLAKQEGLFPILKSFDNFSSNNFTSITDEIINLINDPNNNFSSITFYSNFFKSFFIQKPIKHQLTPIEKNNQDEDDISEPFFEQDTNEILNFLALRYLRSSILYILFQSILAEQTARFLAMDTATTNANKFIETLTLKYNKARQTFITKELAELSASFGKLS